MIDPDGKSHAAGRRQQKGSPLLLSILGIAICPRKRSDLVDEMGALAEREPAEAFDGFRSFERADNPAFQPFAVGKFLGRFEPEDETNRSKKLLEIGPCVSARPERQALDTPDSAQHDALIWPVKQHRSDPTADVSAPTFLTDERQQETVARRRRRQGFGSSRYSTAQALCGMQAMGTETYTPSMAHFSFANSASMCWTAASTAARTPNGLGTVAPISHNFFPNSDSANGPPRKSSFRSICRRCGCDLRDRARRWFFHRRGCQSSRAAAERDPALRAE